MICALLLTAGSARGDRFGESNPRSDPELLSVVAAFADAHPDRLLAVPVRDVRLTDQALELSLIEGTLFAEPPVDGRRAVFYFEGRATMRFAPSERTARDALAFWFGEGHREVRVTARRLLVASFRERELTDELGIDLSGARPAAPADPEGYEETRAAFGRRGVTATFLQLNRRGPSRGAFYALVAADQLRRKGSEKAHLLYAHDPSVSPEVRLLVEGHRESARQANLPADQFGLLAMEHSRLHAFQPQARVEGYTVDLRMGGRREETRATTEISFEPSPGLSLLHLYSWPDRPIERVRDEKGHDLPFVQWSMKPEGDGIPTFSVLVDLRRPDRPAHERLLIETGGRQPQSGKTACLVGVMLHPCLADDSRPHPLGLAVDLPKRWLPVSPGQRVTDVVSGGRRRVVFRTKQLSSRNIVCSGEFRRMEGKAGDLALEVFFDAVVPDGMEWAKHARATAEAATKLYSRLLGPPGEDTLRLLLSGRGLGFPGSRGMVLLPVYSTSGAEVRGFYFDARFVAAQWWGQIVDGRDWPKDRWIGEAFAGYMAMEYWRLAQYDLRQYRDAMRYSWRTFLRRPKKGRSTLLGATVPPRIGQGHALTDGTDLVVRTKGPLVIQMLRHLFSQRTGSDERFWQMLRDLFEGQEYRQISTEEFRRHAENALGTPLDWFWDQWVYGTGIPTVVWHSRRERTKDGWKVIVEAEQQDTDFRLLVPVYIDKRGGGFARRTLEFEGRGAKVEIELPGGRKPKRIELNRYFEALVELEER